VRSSGSKDLYDAWHVLKFVVQEIDRPLADTIGRRSPLCPRNARRRTRGDPRRHPRRAPTALDEGAHTAVDVEDLRTRAQARTAGWIDLHDLSVDSPEVTANLMGIVEDLTLLDG